MVYALKIILITQIRQEDFKLIHICYLPNKNSKGISKRLFQDFSE